MLTACVSKHSLKRIQKAIGNQCNDLNVVDAVACGGTDHDMGRSGSHALERCEYASFKVSRHGVAVVQTRHYKGRYKTRHWWRVKHEPKLAQQTEVEKASTIVFRCAECKMSPISRTESTGFTTTQTEAQTHLEVSGLDKVGPRVEPCQLRFVRI